jgi:hypothetical protein
MNPAECHGPPKTQRPLPFAWLWPVAVGMFLGTQIFGPSMSTPSDPTGIRGGALGGLLGLVIAVILRTKSSSRTADPPGPPDPPQSRQS